MFLLHYIIRAFILAQKDFRKAHQLNLKISGIMALELCPHVWKSQELIPLLVNETMWPVLHGLHYLPQQSNLILNLSKYI